MDGAAVPGIVANLEAAVEIKEVGQLTDTGVRRSLNEDAVLAVNEVPIFAVADGMGGADSGDVASAMAMSFLKDSAPVLMEEAKKVSKSSRGRLDLAEVLEAVLGQIHSEIEQEGERSGKTSMATTLVAAMIVGNNATIAHVGDSRAYLYRDGRLRLLTDDHTLAMLRLRQGRLTEEEFRHSPLRHRLYQALGVGREVDVDTAEVPLADDDVLLLTSDGIHAQLDAKQILGCIRQGTLQQGAARLVDAANKAGGKDNASALLIRVGTDKKADSVDAIAAILKEVFLFRNLSGSERNRIAPYLDQRVLTPGETLFNEGDPGDAFYIVLDGKVRITKGNTHLVDIGPGGHFGELCLARPVPRSATVTAIDETLIFGLSRTRFGEINRRRPGMGATLSLGVLDYVGDRLRDMTDRLHTVEMVAKGELKPPGMKPRDAILSAVRGKLKS